MEFLRGNVPISIKRAKGQAGPIKQPAETPLLVEALVAERMCTQPTRAQQASGDEPEIALRRQAQVEGDAECSGEGVEYLGQVRCGSPRIRSSG
eukprot:8077938-Pyramimonas_sp.AAC.1